MMSCRDWGKRINNFWVGDMKKATYFGLHYLYFLTAILLGVLGILMVLKYHKGSIFPFAVSIVFILSGIIGLGVITAELILYLKGENTD